MESAYARCTHKGAYRCVRFLDYNHASAYNHKVWASFLLGGNAEAHPTENIPTPICPIMNRNLSNKTRTEQVQENNKKRSQPPPNHIHDRKCKTKSKRSRQGRGKAKHKVSSLLPSMLHQRLHNGVVTLIEHLNNKRSKNTSRWETEQVDPTRILTISDYDEYTSKIFSLSQYTSFSAYDMTNGASVNFYTMKTIMVFIKPPLRRGVIPASLLLHGLL